ncbi:MAG: hypothetical protein ACI9LX_000644 [Paraglaciecola sp.]|jgi:hypothetical protein
MRKNCLSYLALCCLLMMASTANAASFIKGYIDSVSGTYGNYQLKGWACQTGYKDSIKVHVYVGGAAGTGKILKGASANQSSETGVASACGSTGVNYRFSIPITNSEVQAHQGKAIYVHGISSIGSANLTITKSGHYKVPTAPVSQVKGYIDRISGSFGTYKLDGWACQTGYKDSIKVHVYVGGAAGTGKILKGASANQSSETGVASACGSTGVNYRFSIPITNSEVQAHQGKAIYVHGISVIGSSNLTLAKSGSYTMPTVPLYLSTFLKGKDANSDVIEIPKGISVEIDQSVKLRLLKISGELNCPLTGDFTIETEGILVEGQGAKLSCGSASSPFNGNISFVFTGDNEISNISTATHNMGSKAFVAHMNGEISLYGKSGKSGFVYLKEHAEVDSATIELSQAVNWQVGDEIVVASTGFDPHEAETFTIMAIASNRRLITLNTALRYKHWGKTEAFSNNSTNWVLNERAEVINLTRNIKVMSKSDSYTTTDEPKGAHMMIMGAGSKGFIDQVEFFRVGRMAEMGRYPFHWHKKGDVSGQFIKNSSIHESYNRCVTIHETDNALVEGNSCYDHFGHGFFLEDGSERNNIIRSNIGLSSKKVPFGSHLLISDVQSSAPARFAAPATFWITNPDNIVDNNISAGSEGSGFWMAFKKSVPCGHCDKTLTPISTNTTSFNNNIAHSNVIGITHDGAQDGASLNNPRNPNDLTLVSAHYRPSTVPEFKNLVVYKSSRAGLYFRGTRAVYKNTVLADNAWSGFFAYDQELVDSLIIGHSNNHPESETDFHFDSSRNQGGGQNWQLGYAGVVVYDGPFYLNNVHFANFSENAVHHGGKDITPMPITLMGGAMRFENKVKGLTFNPQPFKKIDLDPNLATAKNWADSYVAIVRDEDGSLTGNTGYSIRPNHPMNQVYDDTLCDNNLASNEWNIIACDYTASILRIQQLGKVAINNLLSFNVHRKNEAGVSGYEPSIIPAEGQYYSKLSLITNGDYRYHIDNFIRDNNTESTSDDGNLFRLILAAKQVGDITPIISIDFDDNNFTENCRLTNISEHSSLNSLRNSNDSGFVKVIESGVNNFYFKLRSTTNSQSVYALDCQ